MKRIGLLLIALVTLVSTVFAEEESDWKLTLVMPRMMYFIVPTGGDLGFTYSGLEFAEGLNTYVFLKAGGGYEERLFFHDETGAPMTGAGSVDPANINVFKYRTPNFQWEAVLYQGLVWNERTDDNLIEAFLSYRGRLDFRQYVDSYGVVPYLFSSPFEDRDGLFGNSVMAGFCLKDLTRDDHQVWKGVYGEVSAEYGPSWLGNSLFGRMDFWRVNAQVRGFLPLFDLDAESELNRLSVYLGNAVNVDYSGGSSIPMHVIQTFGGKVPRPGLGGKVPRPGLGGTVRGFDKLAFDTRFKAVNNLELRVNGPAFLKPNLLPVLYTYFDAGYYAGYQSSPGVFTDDAGFLCSTGVGLAINVLGIQHLHVAFDKPVYGERLDGRPWFLDIFFGLHF